MDAPAAGGSSTAQEAVPLAAIVLTHLGPGRNLRYETDSADLAHALQKGRSPSTRLNALIRLILVRAAQTGAEVQVVWHPRTSPNQRRADCLSRGDVQGFQDSYGSDWREWKIPDSTLGQIFQCA